MITLYSGMAVRNSITLGKDFGSGTIGGFLMRDNNPNDIYLLSCSHVLAPFVTMPDDGGNDIVVDGPNGSTTVATLTARTFKRLGRNQFDTDAAIAKIDNNVARISDGGSLGAVLTGTSQFITPELPVFIVGKDDDKPRPGIVRDKIKVGQAIKVRVLETPEQQNYILPKVTRVDDITGDNSFGNPGDSGAMVFNRFGLALGIQTAWIENTEHRYFCPIDLVLRDLEKAANFDRGSLSLIRQKTNIDLPVS